MPDETLSYDEIYDLLRTEKFAAELQNLTPHDLEKIKRYLEDKQKLLKQQENSSQIFNSQKRAMIQIEIENALRALRDLYEFREKKILNRAVFSVRTGKVIRDTTNMLAHEEEFYNKLIEYIPVNREKFFKLLEPGSPSLIPEKEEEPATKGAEDSETVKSEEVKFVKVKFLEAVEGFVAQDLKSYGPYSAGAEEEIPETIANLLIGQNKVELRGKNDEIPKTREDVLPEVQEAPTSPNQTGEDQSQT